MSEDTRIERAREVLERGHREFYGSSDGQDCVLIPHRSWEKLAAIISEPDPQPEPKRHQWSRDGETCVVCGDKDCMGGQCKPAPQPESEDGERVLVWHKKSGLYVEEGGGKTADYRKAARFRKGTAEDLIPEKRERYALADLNGWVASWGEQPVGDWVAVEAIFASGGKGETHDAGRWRWRPVGSNGDITHFRLPAPSEPSEAEKDRIIQEEIDAAIRNGARVIPAEPAAWDDRVRRIVDERLAADHRRVGELIRYQDYRMYLLHNCRANELDGGED